MKVIELRYIPTMYLKGVRTGDFPEDNGTLGGRFKECKRYLCSTKLHCMYDQIYSICTLAIMVDCICVIFRYFNNGEKWGWKQNTRNIWRKGKDNFVFCLK